MQLVGVKKDHETVENQITGGNQTVKLKWIVQNDLGKKLCYEKHNCKKEEKKVEYLKMVRVGDYA